MAAPERRFRCPSPEATEALGQALGRRVEGSLLIALQGELGSGKTTFVRGLARGLGVDEAVTSPTFTLMHEYAGRLPLRHFDAWMQGREEAFLESGAAELFEFPAPPGGVAVVEWAERIAAWLPDPRLVVELRHAPPAGGAPAEPGTGCRWLRLTAAGEGAAGLGALISGLRPPSGVVELPEGESPAGGEPPPAPSVATGS